MKSIIIGSIDNNATFKKINDYVGRYDEGEFIIFGYIKTHSDMYNKDQYSLYTKLKDEYILLNVPSWYGVALESDFKASGENAETYFNNCSIKEIRTFTTKYNTDSYNIEIF